MFTSAHQCSTPYSLTLSQCCYQSVSQTGWLQTVETCGSGNSPVNESGCSEPMENHVWILIMHVKTQAWLPSPVTAELSGRDRQIPRTPWIVSLVRMLSFRFTKTPCLRGNEAEKAREKSAKSCSDLHMHKHQCVCTCMCARTLICILYAGIYTAHPHIFTKDWEGG